MHKQIAIVAILFVFFSAYGFADDTNASMDELRASISDLQNQLNSVNQTRTEIVTLQLDQESQQLMHTLEEKILGMETKVDALEENIFRMRNEIISSVEMENKSVVEELDRAMVTNLNENFEKTKEWIRIATNPIRLNLPTFGLMFMVMAGFMLIAGLRRKTAVKAADAEQIANDKRDGERHG